MELDALIKLATEEGAPDLHLHVGQPPIMRSRTGQLVPVSAPPLTEADIQKIIAQITTDEQKARLHDDHELDFSYRLEGVARFRVNVYEERRGPAVAMRVIPETIPTMDDLGLEEAIKQFIDLPHGLVLITGATGMGKSTVLASMIDAINEQRSAHIITIEDPIEFVFTNKKSLVTQREVNVHTRSFSSAIRSALRQDPNVVMVGEMRDLETIAAALTLAETGHLVFSTLHTQDAAQTIDRIIDVFPPYQQQQIRAQLAGTLRGVVSQILIPRADGAGRIAAREIMMVNDAAKSCIARAETHQLYSVIQLGGSEGMILMDQAVLGLAEKGLITPEEALSKATDIEAMQERLTAMN